MCWKFAIYCYFLLLLLLYLKKDGKRRSNIAFLYIGVGLLQSDMTFLLCWNKKQFWKGELLVVSILAWFGADTWCSWKFAWICPKGSEVTMCSWDLDSSKARWVVKFPWLLVQAEGGLAFKNIRKMFIIKALTCSILWGFHIHCDLKLIYLSCECELIPFPSEGFLG